MATLKPAIVAGLAAPHLIVRVSCREDGTLLRASIALNAVDMVDVEVERERRGKKRELEIANLT